MNKPLVLAMEHLLHRDPVEGTWRGGYLTGDFERKVSYQGMCRRRLWKNLSLSMGAPLGNLEGGVHLLGTLRENRRRTPEMEHLSAGALLGEPGGGTPLLGIQKDT